MFILICAVSQVKSKRCHGKVNQSFLVPVLDYSRVDPEGQRRLWERDWKQKRENSKQKKWRVESVRETKILALHTIKETGEIIIGLLYKRMKMKLLTLLVFLVFQHAFYRAEYHPASNTIDKFLQQQL